MRSARRWVWVLRALTRIALERAWTAVVEARRSIVGIVPVERRPELRRRLLVCLVAYIVAFLLTLLPIPFVTHSSLVQTVIQFIAPAPSCQHCLSVGQPQPAVGWTEATMPGEST